MESCIVEVMGVPAHIHVADMIAVPGKHDGTVQLVDIFHGILLRWVRYPERMRGTIVPVRKRRRSIPDRRCNR